MKNKNLVMGVVIASIASIIAVAYLYNKEQEIKSKETKSSVVSAAKFIPAGATISAEHLKATEIPEMYIQPNAARSAENVVGKVAITNISEGEQVLANKITKLYESLSSAVPMGYRAVALPVDPSSSAAALIKPGDVVDILGTFDEGGKAYTATILQNVRVIGINDNFNQYGKKKADPYSVSGDVVLLAVDPSDAEIITFAESKGRVKLVLRNPDDDKVTNQRNTNFGNLLRNQQREMARPAPEIPSLEIIKGTQSERVPLKK